jgi:hypothetical protein
MVLAKSNLQYSCISHFYFRGFHFSTCTHTADDFHSFAFCCKQILVLASHYQCNPKHNQTSVTISKARSGDKILVRVLIAILGYINLSPTIVILVVTVEMQAGNCLLILVISTTSPSTFVILPPALAKIQQQMSQRLPNPTTNTFCIFCKLIAFFFK